MYGHRHGLGLSKGMLWQCTMSNCIVVACFFENLDLMVAAAKHVQLGSFCCSFL